MGSVMQCPCLNFEWVRLLCLLVFVCIVWIQYALCMSSGCVCMCVCVCLFVYFVCVCVRGFADAWVQVWMSLAFLCLYEYVCVHVRANV